jgi:hypothetical protein
MSDNTPQDPSGPDDFDFEHYVLPKAPPMRPDLNLIGDLQKPEKIDRHLKRRWFGLRPHSPA